MDYRVWRAMLLVCLLSLGLYSYKQIRSNQMNDRPCPPDTINVNNKRVEFVAICYLDRLTPFEFESESAETVDWDFGDGTFVKKGRIVSHKFEQEGFFTVKVTVNGACEFQIEVEVTENPLLAGNLAKPVVEVYSDPKRPVKGSTVKFYCATDIPIVTSYEWRIKETGEVQKDAVPAFTFKNGGTYTVELIVNNDPLTETKTAIGVADIPQLPENSNNSSAGMGMPGDIGQLRNLIPPGGNPSNMNNDHPSSNAFPDNNQGIPKPDTLGKASLPKAPKIDETAFKALLQNVVDEKGKELEDLYEYLDYKESTRVEVNESETPISLKVFCKKTRDKKKNKRKIESLSFEKDEQKSIRTIRVKVPKSEGFWDRVNPFN